MAYFSNSVDGEILGRQCADCPLGAGWNDPNQKQMFDEPPEFRDCPVMLIQLTYNYDQVGNKNLTSAMNLLVDENSVCLVRRELVEVRADEEKTRELFETGGEA